MGLKAGIVGLPNVGKSTLFNAITNSHVEAANYPFATINPNTRIVAVPDERLDFLVNIFKPERTIPATIEFYDIAGLVRGASKGEGLGNQFLSHIRECDAIVEVVRCFKNADIIIGMTKGHKLLTPIWWQGKFKTLSEAATGRYKPVPDPWLQKPDEYSKSMQVIKAYIEQYVKNLETEMQV